MKNFVLISIILACILTTGYINYTVSKDTEVQSVKIIEEDHGPGCACIICVAQAICKKYPVTIDPNDRDYR